MWMATGHAAQIVGSQVTTRNKNHIASARANICRRTSFCRSTGQGGGLNSRLQRYKHHPPASPKKATEWRNVPGRPSLQKAGQRLKQGRHFVGRSPPAL